MTITSGLFNSINGDRKYNAWWFALYFSTFIGNGVFPNPSSNLQVMENENMTTTVKPGKGWIDGYFIVNDSDYVLQHDIADGVLNRIDRIVMRLNHLTRLIEILVKKGTFASSPIAPGLVNDEDYHELALADVYISAGVTSITQVNITDTRLNNNLCGIVHGTVGQVDTETIYNQYLDWFNQTKNSNETELDQFMTDQQEAFNTWFDSVKGQLEGDVAANLANQIAELNREFSEHKADYVKHPGFGVTTNLANAYSVTLDPAPTVYIEGMGVSVKINADSTGASTLNVNGLGAKALKKANGNDFTNLKINGVYTFRYNASTENFILQGEGGDLSDADTANFITSVNGILGS